MPDVFDQPVIGIDLGASYTKISFRADWANGSQKGDARRYQYASKIISVDGGPLIPSLVIFTKRNGWICGREAAEYVPTKEDQVYRNWKSVVFSKGSPREVDGALDAAGSFFKWLKERLDAIGLPVDRSRVKICLPAFEDIELTT